MKTTRPFSLPEMKRLFPLCCLVLFLVFTGILSASELHLSTFIVPYRSYTFDYWRKAVEGPIAYLPKAVITAEEIGVENLRQPKDIFVDQNNDIYIADTGNNRILHLDSEWNLKRIIDGFINQGEKDTFSRPNSLVITADQYMYVADTGNARVVQLDQNGDLVRIYTSPHVDNEGVFDANFNFRPLKIGVNEKGHLFILSEDFFEGIITIDADGIFRGLIGAPKVSVSLTEYIWFRLSTDEQRSRRSLFLPTEYSSLTIDDQGFLYATVTSEEDDSIKRLNPAGTDTLRRAGAHEIIGDLNYTNMWQQSTYYGRSQFVDVTVLPLNGYSVLDRTRSRIYTYDNDGNLLYMFGYRGRTHGQIARGAAIDNIGLDLIVLDDERSQILIFEPTEYTKLIWTALEHYDKGEYAEAEAAWRKILEQNANYDLAYTGIGRSLLLREEFEEAMYYFKHGNNRNGYSLAFQEYRKMRLEENFGLLMTVVILVILLITYWPKLTQRWSKVSERQAAVSSEVRWLELSEGKTFKDRMLRYWYSLKYSLHVIVHPFDGFYELKYRNRGSLPAAFTILFLVAVTYTLMRQYTGFLFNTNDPSQLNILVELASVLLPFALWVGVNWAFTTLMEGKGTLRNIIIASAYALVPLLLINLPLIVISNYLTLEEGTFYYLFMSIAVFWSGCLMFIGAVMTTHEYGFGRSIFTTILTLVGMIFVIFLGLALMNLLELVYRFINEVVSEIAFRV